MMIFMKYNSEEMLRIEREIQRKELTVNEAAVKYNINFYTARSYLRLYKDKNNLPDKDTTSNIEIKTEKKKPNKYADYDELETLSKDQLIDEVIKARVEAERSKKGYYVKGCGLEKEFISINKTNSKQFIFYLKIIQYKSYARL